MESDAQKHDWDVIAYNAEGRVVFSKVVRDLSMDEAEKLGALHPEWDSYTFKLRGQKHV